MATNGSFAHQEQYKATGAGSFTAGPGAMDSTAPNANSNLSKDEVGWYFVEQYYTTLSKSPEKLHLFYGKRSQFVYGLEAEVAHVCVGRQAIQEKIKALDFQDCKVRVSNVDSQPSFDNIVIQVIGETSNKAGEPKKFVQTFVLAQQPSGYFVLNDILRYIDEETDDEPAASSNETANATGAAIEMPPHEEAVPAAPETTEPAAAPLNAATVDEKLEEVTKEEVAVNGTATEAEVEASDAGKQDEAPVDVEETAQSLADADAKEPEKPQDPAPTPVVKPAAEPAVSQPAPKPAAPPKPMTWASRAAAAAGPRPVVPLPKTSATAPTQKSSPSLKPAALATTSAPAPAQSGQATVPTPTTDAPASKDNAGWQTAGADSKRQNRPHSISQAPTEKEGTMGYVKFVTDKVQDKDLRDALAAHGDLTYFDINRQKNCAFVEYKTIEGYQAAVSANPHIVNGENIVVEARRPKSTAYGGSNYGSSRGNASGRGRGGYEGNRSGGQGNARGNYSGGQNRPRGGARAHAGAQATNA